MEQAKIERLNELTKISKTPKGLTEQEKHEREELRREYIAAFKASLVSQLDNTYVVGSDGKKRPLKCKNK